MTQGRSLRSVLCAARLGMSHKEVRAKYPDSKRILLMVGPSSDAPAWRIQLDNGHSVDVLYDREWRVCMLSTQDPTYRPVAGIGVGSPYSAVKELFPDARTVPLRGYGTMIEVNPGVWTGFSWLYETLPPGAKVEWIEVRAPECAPGRSWPGLLPEDVLELDTPATQPD